jgi:hypothetical protein
MLRQLRVGSACQHCDVGDLSNYCALAWNPGPGPPCNGQKESCGKLIGLSRVRDLRSWFEQSQTSRDGAVATCTLLSLAVVQCTHGPLICKRCGATVQAEGKPNGFSSTYDSLDSVASLCRGLIVGRQGLGVAEPDCHLIFFGGLVGIPSRGHVYDQAVPPRESAPIPALSQRVKMRQLACIIHQTWSVSRGVVGSEGERQE